MKGSLFTLNFIDAFELNPYPSASIASCWTVDARLARCSRNLSHRQNPEVISPMNIQEASFRNTVANETGERLLLDRSAAFLTRTTTVATAAAAEAADV